MFLFEEADGMTSDEVIDIFNIEHDVLIEFTPSGEAISLASSRPEGSGYTVIFFIVSHVDAALVTQLWLFPSGYSGLHPVQFME